MRKPFGTDKLGGGKAGVDASDNWGIGGVVYQDGFPSW